MPLVFPMLPGNDAFPDADLDADDEAARVAGAVTCTVSLAVGGVFSVVPVGSATAFSVTDCTEVAVELTGSCAGRTMWVVSGAAIVHDAVLLPVTQLVLLKAGARPAGWADRVIVTLPLVGGAQFWLQTCTVNVPDVPR
jgi:hypothetical protein